MKLKRKKIKPITKLKATYQSADDPAQWIWSNRTHSTASEAFRDATYAQAIWKCESDFVYGVRFIGEMLQGMFLMLMYLFIPVLILMWITK